MQGIPRASTWTQLKRDPLPSDTNEEDDRGWGTNKDLYFWGRRQPGWGISSPVLRNARSLSRAALELVAGRTTTGRECEERIPNLAPGDLGTTESPNWAEALLS